MSSLGPADGRQKMRLLDELFRTLVPIPKEETAKSSCQWIPGEAQPSCGFDPDCLECRKRCPSCGCDQHTGFCADCGCLDDHPLKESSSDGDM